MLVCVSLCRKTDKNIAPLQAAMFGAGARAIAATTFLPFTVIKTRYEVSSESGYWLLGEEHACNTS